MFLCLCLLPSRATPLIVLVLFYSILFYSTILQLLSPISFHLHSIRVVFRPFFNYFLPPILLFSISFPCFLSLSLYLSLSLSLISLSLYLSLPFLSLFLSLILSLFISSFPSLFLFLSFFLSPSLSFLNFCLHWRFPNDKGNDWSREGRGERRDWMETGSRRRFQTAVRVPNVILCKYCTNPFIPLISIHCFIVIPSFSVYLSLSVCMFCCFCQCMRVWGCIVSLFFFLSLYIPASFSVSTFL